MKCTRCDNELPVEDDFIVCRIKWFLELDPPKIVMFLCKDCAKELNTWLQEELVIVDK